MHSFDSIILILVVAVPIGILVLMLLQSQYSKANQMLDDWARANGYELVEANNQWLFRGPFWLAPKGTLVYKITVRDSLGQTQTGWALCGDWLRGMWSDRVEVKWDN